MELLEDRQLKWLGHTSKADDEPRKIKQFLKVKPEGQRPKRRPMMTYQSYIEIL